MALLVHGATGSSPYLARLTERHGDWLWVAAAQEPEHVFDGLLTELGELAEAAPNVQALRIALRVAKSRGALLVALADLGGVWALDQVTDALTRLADRSVEVTSRWLLHRELKAGRLPGLGLDDLTYGAGFCVLAMGKMGAGELNYSSDIDLIALFDDQRFDHDTILDARARYIHITKQLVAILSEQAEGGYAFRTDLRLRPSPSTTPVCMAMDAAERYYESVGRTWERAAHIKARALVDQAAGEMYLSALQPFIWRRYLDFAAIDDTHGLLRKIRAQKAHLTPKALPGHDIKLGLGGIREIEFFVQTRQLICGGRDPSLRQRATLPALDALTDAGWVDPAKRDQLRDDYTALRTIEHRLQMIEDAQTHVIPKNPDARQRVAALCGEGDLALFERALSERLEAVHAACEEFYTPSGSGTQATPLLTEQALAEAGFERPDDAARQIGRWHDGSLPAMRNDRSRALFVGLEPRIVEGLARASHPDQALVHFDRFLSGLPAGVQVFSLFTSNPQLLDLIIEICSAAPRLAGYLGRHANVLDALLDRDFWQPLPSLDNQISELTHRLSGEEDYERALDDSRRWAREHWFRAGVHVLRGMADEREAGSSFTSIAEASLDALYPRVISDFARRHGPPPGTGMAVVGMGKLGSGEMTARSDLDLITIYDADGVESSAGPRPLPPATYYPRLTQALVAALTAQTAEGALYDVDMRLRPSGRAGPVAVSLASFEQYQMEGAWVWEHMALTRARVISGPKVLQSAIEDIAEQALRSRCDTDEVLTGAAEMRARLVEAHEAERRNPWSLKHTAGGMMDIEFLAQAGVLHCGLVGLRRADDALAVLGEAAWISIDDAEYLRSTLRILQRLQHVERVAIETTLSPDEAGPDFREVLARVAGVTDYELLARDLQDRMLRCDRICSAKLAARS